MTHADWNRRRFLAATGTGVGAALLAGTPALAIEAPTKSPAKDVPWLAELQKAPEKIPGELPKLAPLLVDADGKPITTLAAWEKRREEIRKWWLDFMGAFPRPTKLPKIDVVETVEVEGAIRQLIKYEAEPGFVTEAYILRPAKLTGKAPGVVVLHSTVDNSIRQPAGADGLLEKAFGLTLARQGCVTISPRNYLWPETIRQGAKVEAQAFQARHPKRVGMARMLHDAQLAVDILLARDDVDPARIGSVGHSLGAKEVLYLAAFDDRVKATVSSEGGIGTKFSNWNDIWYLGPKIAEPEFTHEHHELLALAAPRPFLLIGGQSADGDQSWPFIEAALPVWKLYGEPARLALFNHRKGHKPIPPESSEKIHQWLLNYL